MRKAVPTHDARGGYVALYRNLLDNPLMTQLPAAWFRVFVAILLRANWKAGKWWDGSREVMIPAGSMVTSVDKLRKATKSSVRETRNALEYLKTTNALAIQTTSHYSIITVVNWDRYQKVVEPDGKPNGKQKDKPQTNQRQTKDKAAATIEQRKKETREEGNKKSFPEPEPDPEPEPETETEPTSRTTRSKLAEAPAAQMYNSKHSAEDRKQLATVMLKNTGEDFDPGSMEMTMLLDSFALDDVLLALGNEQVPRFCKYLENLPPRFKAGGKFAPIYWAWFVATAKRYAEQKPLGKPTEFICCHGKTWGTCCNAPEVHDSMTESFSTLDDFRSPA